MMVTRRYVDLVFGDELTVLSGGNQTQSGLGADSSASVGDSVLSIGYARDDSLVKLVETYSVSTTKSVNRGRPTWEEVSGGPRHYPDNLDLPPYTLTYDTTTGVSCVSTFKWVVETTAEDGTISTVETTIPVSNEFSAEVMSYVDIDFFGGNTPAAPDYAALRLNKAASSYSTSLGMAVVPLAADTSNLFAAFLVLECASEADYMRPIEARSSTYFTYWARVSGSGEARVSGTFDTLQGAADDALYGPLTPPAILQPQRWEKAVGDAIVFKVALLLVTGDAVDRVELGQADIHADIHAWDLSSVLIDVASAYGSSGSTAFSYLPVSAQREHFKTLPSVEARGGFVRISTWASAFDILYDDYGIPFGTYFGRKKLAENSKYPKAGFYADPNPIVLGTDPEDIELAGIVRKRFR